MQLNNYSEVLVWYIPYIISGVMLITTAICAVFFTEPVRIDGCFCPIRFNRDNRIFIAGIEAFYYAILKICCSQLLMDLCKIACKNDQFFTTMLYDYILFISIALYWCIVYLVFTKVSSMRQKALRKLLRRRGKYARKYY